MPNAPVVPSCDSGRYWNDLESALRQPEWLASVGIPLALTLVGLAVAYMLVKRQINHDRDLRDADRAASAVNESGREILRILRHGETNWPDDPYWSEESWPGSIPLYEAHTRVMVALSDPLVFVELQRAGRDLARAWRACHVRRKRLAKNGITSTRPSERNRHGGSACSHMRGHDRGREATCCVERPVCAARSNSLAL